MSVLLLVQISHAQRYPGSIAFRRGGPDIAPFPCVPLVRSTWASVQFVANNSTASLPAGEGPACFSPSSVKDWQPRRKSVSNACERCRRRKIRCDGDTPCSTCKRFSQHCMRTQKPREVVASSVPPLVKRVIASSRDKHSLLPKGTPSRARRPNTSTRSPTSFSHKHANARHGVD